MWEGGHVNIQAAVCPAPIVISKAPSRLPVFYTNTLHKYKYTSHKHIYKYKCTLNINNRILTLQVYVVVDQGIKSQMGPSTSFTSLALPCNVEL